MGRVVCYKCKYYKITWDTHFPYACQSFNFKSSKTPSLVVYESSGEECKFFTPKEPRRRL